MQVSEMKWVKSFFLFFCLIVASLKGENIESLQRRILVTACNAPYFQSCLTLIASVHRTSLAVIDEMVVYNLGLDPIQIEILNTLKNVRVKSFEEIKHKYPELDLDFFYTRPACFGWKQVCLKDVTDREGDLVFWLDAGIVLLGSAQEIYDQIERDDIFLVRDPSQINAIWTHTCCIEIMDATENELSDFQLLGGIQGHKRGGKYQNMMDEALKYSLIRECIEGYKFFDYGFSMDGNRIQGHRHDQSILSILASRYQCPLQDISRYGEWRSYQHCLTQNSLIWVHRTHYQNYEGLLFHN